jgi:hypothetical protein
MRNDTKFWSGNLNGRDHSENLVIDASDVLELMLMKWGEKMWIGFI